VQLLTGVSFALAAIAVAIAPAVAFDKDQEIRAFEFAKELNKGDQTAVLPTFRNLLEVMEAAARNPAGRERSLGIRSLNKPLTLGTVPSAVEKDSRTQANFISEGGRRDRIWLGVPARDVFPGSVALQTAQGALCSGVLIDETTVVTAAHCFCRGDAPQLIIFGPSMNLTEAKVVKVNAARSKPKAACEVYADGDVAVVGLAEKAQVTPITIAAPALIAGAKSVRIVGFGLTEKGASGAKLMVDVPIASHTCEGTSDRGTDASIYGCYPDGEMVASTPLTSRDSCNGDSGGGAFVQTTNGDWQLAAVVSRGIQGTSARPCGDGGIYARVDGSKMREWLRSNGVHLSQ
jgi:Trypsin